MNPTLEVQITAKLDKLDAGLKVAEAKVSQSAQTMGKTGEKAAANFGESFAANLPMMMVATAMAKTIGGGLLKAVEDVNAGKSGEEIGLNFAQGIVDGAKSLPVVGVVFGILDEMVNGAQRYIDKLNEAVTKGVEKYISSMQAMTQATRDFQKTSREKVEDVADAGDPAKIARRAAERQNQKADADAQAAKELGQQALRDQRKAQDEKDAATIVSIKSEGIEGDIGRRMTGRISRDEQIAQEKKASDSARRRAEQANAKIDAEIDAALAARKIATEEELNKKLAELNKKAQDDKSAASAASAAATSSLQGKNIKTAIDTGDYQSARKQINAKADADKKALDEPANAARKTAYDKMIEDGLVIGNDPKKVADDYATAIKGINAKIAADKKDLDVKAAADQKALDEKSQKEAKEMGNQMVADFKEQKREMYDAAMQAQDDIIKGEQAVQKKVDKAKVFSEAVSSAGQGFINSGQTALGQFNFAQQGAGSSAIDMAKKQVASLEKIEQATAEQVRLTKENKGFL